MKKIILIVCVLIVGAVLVMLSFMNAAKLSDQTDDVYIDFSNENGLPLDENSPTMPLTTRNNTIIVRNFLQDSKTYVDPVNPGHYQLGTFVDPASPDAADVPFSIEYIAETQYFIISLLETPIAESRKEAEEFLLSYLGVSQTELCSIKYMVSTPARIDVRYAGQNLGFSFCDYSTSL